VRSFGLTLVPFESSQGDPVIAIGGRIARPDDIARGLLPLDLQPAEKGLDQAALLEHYVGAVPADLAEVETSATSYSRWRSFDRLTWPAWLRARGASADAVKLMTLGGDSSDLSALYVLRQFAMLRKSTERYKIQGGLDLLPRAMASALGNVIRYNAAVLHVTRLAGKAAAARFRIDYQAGGRVESVTAGRVIFAVPFTTLRDIEVRPRLSRQKEHVIAQLSYYPTARFLLQSKHRFWRSAGLSGSARTDRTTEIWDATFDQTASVRGILGASTGGSSGRTVLGMTPDESLKFGSSLVAVALPSIQAELE
jgi:monoamine oxidase